MEDLREECSKYGGVAEILVPRPNPPALSEQLFGSGHYGKVRPLPPLRLTAVVANAFERCPVFPD